MEDQTQVIETLKARAEKAERDNEAKDQIITELKRVNEAIQAERNALLAAIRTMMDQAIRR